MQANTAEQKKRGKCVIWARSLKTPHFIQNRRCQRGMSPMSNLSPLTFYALYDIGIWIEQIRFWMIGSAHFHQLTLFPWFSELKDSVAQRVPILRMHTVCFSHFLLPPPSIFRDRILYCMIGWVYLPSMTLFMR
jgi:hypothetical protein